MMKRIWAIEEQVYVDPITKLRFEFTSAHTEAMSRGEGPTLNDNYLMFNVYNESNTRVIRMAVERNGRIWDAKIEGMEGVETPKTQDEIESEQRAAWEKKLADKMESARTAVKVNPEDDPEQQKGPAEYEGINLAGQFTSDIE
jgi:hypothetical protein